jgi:hypothetical protein
MLEVAMTNRAFLLLITAAAAVACGCATETGNPPVAETASPAATADLEACALVTRDQVTEALGSPVGQGEERGLVGCGWRTESGTEVVLQVYAGSMLASSTCDGQKFLVSGQQEEVAGLGDSAVWGSSGDLVVCSSTAVLKVDVENTPNSPDEDRDVAVKVARAALARLQG